MWFYNRKEKKKKKQIQMLLEINEKIKDLEEWKNIKLNDKERAEFIAHEIEYRNLLKWYDRVLILGLVISPLSYFIGVHLIALGKYLGIF